jgi:heterotetrameric sarcosine oxidase delta subunit
MRLNCPLCGNRDRREFYYYGAADWLDRPGADAAPEAWTGYIHLRDNPAGITRDLWYHEQGCGSWLAVTRDTVTHAIHAVEAIAPTDAAGGPGAPVEATKKPGRKKKGADDAA